MKIFVSFMLQFIGLVASIITISSSVAPDITSNYVNEYLSIIVSPRAIVIVGVITLLIPITFGIINSKRYGGFKKLYSPKHLLASVLLSEFWYGFLYGVRQIGFFVVVLASLYFLYVKVLFNGMDQ